MKAGWWVIVALLALAGTEAEAGGTVGGSSGGAMQGFDSRMMTSPAMRFPGLSLWPYTAYPPASPRTNVNVEIQLPEVDPPPTPPARSKFWTARCGVFVELEVSSTMNLMEEERKPCAP